MTPKQDGSVIVAFMNCIRKQVDDELIIFDEALTASSYVSSFLPRTKDGTFFQTRGGSLGVGLPGAIGIQLASPAANILAFTGDGGCMYTIQALHTAIRYHLPVKLVICSNGRYQLLDNNIQAYWKEQAADAMLASDEPFVVELKTS